MPLYREDFDEILEYIQICKLHGRSEKRLLFDSLEIVENYANNKEIVMTPNWSDRYDKKKLKRWREFTKNCKFDCWDCGVCGEMVGV